MRDLNLPSHPSSLLNKGFSEDDVRDEHISTKKRDSSRAHGSCILDKTEHFMKIIAIEFGR